MIQEEREERHKYKGVVKTVISAQSEDPMLAALKCVEGMYILYIMAVSTYVHTYACTYEHISSYDTLITL